MHDLKIIIIHNEIRNVYLRANIKINLHRIDEHNINQILLFRYQIYCRKILLQRKINSNFKPFNSLSI